ncbi:MAG: hypothetical protein PHV34_06905 [Verrucomicrobiae bacterium]|nr:hypothetical protein [Verrucomicrobiae bacterium]
MTLKTGGGSARAFTIIELLIVIALLMMLCALLMPALREVKEKANQIKCMSNLKQCGMALLQYADDNEGRAPTIYIYPSWDGMDASWARFLTEIPPTSGWPKGGKYLPNYEVCHCPSEKLRLVNYLPKNNPYEIYGMRSSLGDCFSLFDLRTPASTIVIGDSIIFTTSGGWRQYRGSSDEKPASTSVGTLHLRHAGMANCWFADGHVELCDQTALKRYGLAGGRSKDYSAVDF